MLMPLVMGRGQSERTNYDVDDCSWWAEDKSLVMYCQLIVVVGLVIGAYTVLNTACAHRGVLFLN